MGLPSILPFLAAAKKGEDLSAMTSDNAPGSIVANLIAPSQVAALQAPPPAPPPQAPQEPQPDMSIGAPQVAPPPPPNPLQDLAQGAIQGEQAPKLAPETKGHKLMRVLLGAAYGGLMGAANNAQTYAQTGRNAGFGGGFYGSQVLPLELQHQQLQNEQVRQLLPFLRASQIAGLQKTTAEAQKNQAEAGKAQAETAGLPIHQALEQAQTEAANYKDDPNMGLIDLRTGKPVNNAAAAPLTAEEAQILGKKPGERVPLKLKNQANEIAVRGLTTVNTSEGVFERNRQTGQMTKLGGSPTMMRMEILQDLARMPAFDTQTNRPVFISPREAANNPDRYQPAGASPTLGAEKAIQKSAVAGPIANEINAFNTALQHAQLLREAAKALNNGDVRTLNGLSNRAQSEFGDPNLTNFDAINHVYQNEIQKMLAGGHITNQELDKNSASLPSNANYATIDKVLGSYEALAKSKLQMRQQQIEKGMQGQPNLPAASAGIKVGDKVTLKNGQTITVKAVHPDGSFD